MYSSAFSILFVSFFILTLVLQVWLAGRQLRHVVAHRNAVPADFAAKIPLEAHQKAADYTVAKTRFGLVELFFGGALLICFTLLGGLQLLSQAVMHYAGTGMRYQVALVCVFLAIGTLLDLPFSYYRHFVLEERFGFNKMSRRLWVKDLITWSAIGAAGVVPLVWIVLTLMEKSGALWWVYSWAVTMAFLLLFMALMPNVIMPLFNKFTPLSDASLKGRIDALLVRAGFASRHLFVMDGSKRSSHGNAYFSGFGASKRIVFYDTLVDSLAPQEVEAVLAHELGHFKLRHTVKHLIVMAAVLLGFLAMLGYLKDQVWFYTGLGVDPIPGARNDALALLLFMLVQPVFTFFLGPLTSITSRKHEFEADAFAATHSDARDLVSALVKMYEDNASTLTPDPLHSAFFDSHPPASVRVAHLNLAAP